MACSSCGAAFKGACGRGAHCGYDMHFGDASQSSRSNNQRSASPNSGSGNGKLEDLPPGTYDFSGIGLLLVIPVAVIYYVHKYYAEKNKDKDIALDAKSGKQNHAFTKIFASAAALGVLSIGGYAAVASNQTQISMDIDQITYRAQRKLGIMGEYTIGIQLETPRNSSYARIAFLDSDGAAARAGLRIGDHILSVDGTLVGNDPGAIAEFLKHHLNDPDQAATEIRIRRETPQFLREVPQFLTPDYKEYVFTFTNPQTVEKEASRAAFAADVYRDLAEQAQTPAPTAP